MEQGKSWQLGSPGTLIYWLYDRLRQRLNRWLVGYLTQTIDKNGSKRFLEAGSGPAFASSLLSRFPGVVLSVALDLDLEALLEARQRDPALPVLVANLEHLPFASGSFYMVWNSSTLEHLPNRVDALKEMSRVTQGGGRVFIGVPYLYGPLGFQRWIAKTSLGVWIGEVFDCKTLKALITNCGMLPNACTFYFYRFFIGILAEKSI